MNFSGKKRAIAESVDTNADSDVFVPRYLAVLFFSNTISIVRHLAPLRILPRSPEFLQTRSLRELTLRVLNVVKTRSLSFQEIVTILID